MSLVSVLRPFSYGQVVVNNDEQNREIKVKVLEHLPSQYGEPTDDISLDTIDVNTFNTLVFKDEKTHEEEFEQQTRTVAVAFKDWVSANWLNRTANRISPPKVVIGQRVLLWRVGDSRQYYWEELDVDMRLKPDEHILIALNNQNEGKTLDLDNSYIIEWSTVHGRLRARTNRNNDELAAYEVDINGKLGYLKIMDDNDGDKEDYRGNGMLINSVDTIVTLQNIDKSFTILDKKNITIECPEAFTINAKTSTINTKTHTVNADSNFTKTVAITNSLTVNGPTTLTKGAKFGDAVSGTVANWSVVCSAPNI